MVTAPSRHEKYSPVPGKCGVPATTAPGANSIRTSISSGTGSGTSGRCVTPRPCALDGSSDALHLRTFPRGEESSSSIGTRSCAATFTSTASDGLPSPDSRFAMVERGTPADLSRVGCVRPRAWRRLERLRARCEAMRSGLSIRVTLCQSVGHCLEDYREDSILMERRLVQMNRRIAITGGTSGLGLALVRELARRGERVAFVARHAEAVARVVRENPGTVGIVGDVSRKEDIYPIPTQILGNPGGRDVLVNNASALGPVPL